MDAIDRELALTTTAPLEQLGLVTRCEQFDEIMQSLNKDRSDVYGHPLDDFHNNAIGMEVINKCADPEIRHALAMIWVKICRLVNTPEHFDTAADAAGYARTICMIIDERERRDVIERKRDLEHVERLKKDFKVSPGVPVAETH